MKRLKRVALLCCAALVCLSGLAGCTENQEEGQPLAVCVGDSPVSLDPIYAEDSGDQSILTQLYENLMRVTTDAAGNQTVANGMAKRVTQKNKQDGTVVYTFDLHNAKWSDGVPVKADDFVYAWRRLASPASQSPYASLLSVVAGYQEARASGDMSLLQVEAENDSTLVVTLDGRYEWFLTEVCTSPATMPLREDVVQRLKEQNQAEDGGDAWWSDPTALVTNGAYVVSDWEPEEGLTAQRSSDYESHHVGPSEIRFRFADDAEEAWELYENKEVDVVWPLPEKQLMKLSKDQNWAPVPELSTHAVLFNYNQEQLADPEIRKAMTLVLDRNALAEAKGPLVLPAEGLVPHGVPENEQGDFRTVAGALYENDSEGYSERCNQAKALLDEAGYSTGESLGQMEYLYVEEGNNGAVAEAICRMWNEALNLSVTPKGVTEGELWAALRSGDYQLAGVDLVAPGNDAECFLMQWTSDSHDNVVRYRNSAYDTLMNIIATASSDMARMGCLHDAEVLLLSDNVVVPLYTEGTGWMVRDGYTGLCRDPRGWFSFTEVFRRNG